jgi:hypothetical protein
MDRFIPVQLACACYLASERTLELHARRGNLPFRGEVGARLYDREALARLFIPRSKSATSPGPGTLGSVRMGASLGPVRTDVRSSVNSPCFARP